MYPNGPIDRNGKNQMELHGRAGQGRLDIVRTFLFFYYRYDVGNVPRISGMDVARHLEGGVDVAV